jgi:deoxyribonuclease-2
MVWQFMNNNVVVKTASSKVTNVTSVGGITFTHFAKTVAWGQSIYGNLIGPFYNENLVVETWQRPYEDPLVPPTVPDSVYSVLALQSPIYAFDQTAWKMTQDHSKWGISTDSSNPVFCVGDINKQKSQWKRSGGMACIVDQTFFNAYSGLVTKTDQGGVDMASIVESIAME